MKRSGANMRKRTEATIAGNERPRGPLTDEEIAAVRRAYADGCRGEVIIGMRGDERVITMLVPAVVGLDNGHRLQAMRAELRKLGCYGMCRVSRTRNAFG